MKTNNTFGIHFIVRTKKNSSEQGIIYARITVNRRRIELSLKKEININEWNKDRGAVKSRTHEASSINTFLEQVRSRLGDCYQQLLVQKKLITAEAIKNLFYGIEEEEHTLLSLFDYHNNEMKSKLEWGTIKNYFTTRRYIAEFVKARHKTSDLFLSQLNYKFLNDFEKFLREYKPRKHQKPCGNNTIMKHIERLRKIINMAVRYEWLDRDPFQQFKASFIKSERQFLTKEDLALIENKKFSIKRLQQVKDLFVFSCYTGLAYIDVYNLTVDNISKGIDGGMWIYTERQKTDIPVRIPLLPQASAIIEKYQNDPGVLQSGKLLPVCSNQRLNSYLKEIADLCGIEKNLTFHIARHTFATTVTLSNGVPIETVSKLLGHTSIRTTQIYAKVVEKKVSDDMSILRAKLSNKNTIQRKAQ